MATIRAGKARLPNQLSAVGQLWISGKGKRELNKMEVYGIPTFFLLLLQQISTSSTERRANWPTLGRPETGDRTLGDLSAATKNELTIGKDASCMLTDPLGHAIRIGCAYEATLTSNLVQPLSK